MIYPMSSIRQVIFVLGNVLAFICSVSKGLLPTFVISFWGALLFQRPFPKDIHFRVQAADVLLGGDQLLLHLLQLTFQLGALSLGLKIRLINTKSESCFSGKSGKNRRLSSFKHMFTIRSLYILHRKGRFQSNTSQCLKGTLA